MSLFVQIGIILFICIVLFTAILFVTWSSIAIGKIPKWKENPDLAKAHKYMTVISVLAWISFVLLVVGGILLVVFGSEFIVPAAEEAYEAGGSKGVGWMVKGILLLLVGVCIFLGIIIIIATSYIGKSGQHGTEEGRKAYKDGIIASILTFGTGVIIIGFFVFLMWKSHKKGIPPPSTFAPPQMGLPALPF